ncbi:hypothetical protein H5410_061398 [Solanum commersonii]|uniref:Uncharacterized protein n=1 Tax=Solanum commersonii TaxID=4109 RepID=A0A9J5W916_SOLCO|nr:hypothetical protein H5410_061398 [Solanum commersonii]
MVGCSGAITVATPDTDAQPQSTSFRDTTMVGCSGAITVATPDTDAQPQSVTPSTDSLTDGATVIQTSP